MTTLPIVRICQPPWVFRGSEYRGLLEPAWLPVMRYSLAYHVALYKKVLTMNGASPTRLNGSGNDRVCRATFCLKAPHQLCLPNSLSPNLQYK